MHLQTQKGLFEKAQQCVGKGSAKCVNKAGRTPLKGGQHMRNLQVFFDGDMFAL